MLSIVLPISAIDSVISVRPVVITYKVVVDVHVYVVMPPPGTPSPAATPGCSHRNSDTE
jgi:hypothetical protein